MYLLRKILHNLNDINFPLVTNIGLKLVSVQIPVIKKPRWVMGTLLISIGLIFGISCTSTNPDNHITTAEVIEPLVANTTPIKHVVTIKDMKYNPAVTQANIGDTILFINKDLVPHNVADSLTKEWLSPQLNFGEEWSMIVNKNLHFYCAFHPNMEGDIQLEEPPLNAQKSK